MLPRMLKKHQIIRAIRSALNDRSDLVLLATIGESSYLLLNQQEPNPPQYRLLRLRVDKEEREVKVHAGLSHFDRCQEIVLAPSFTTWREVDLGELPARSKQTLRKSLKRAVSGFRQELHGGYSLMAANATDPTVEQVFSFFTAHRRDLAEQEPIVQGQLKKIATSIQYAELCRLAQLGEAEKGEDELESLLESLGSGGSFSGSSSFSLNQEKALQKLTDFQLGERHLFPLFLAAGLSLRGAQKIDIEIDSDEMWVRFQGCRMDGSVLDRLAGLLLSGMVRAEDRGLKKIGQALLQSAGHNPSALELQLDDVTLDLRGFPDFTNPKEPDVGAESGVFYTKVPLSVAVATRFLKSLSTGHAEADQLKSSLAYLPTSWTVNGEDQSVSLPITASSFVFEWQAMGRALVELPPQGCLLHEMGSSNVPGHIVLVVTPKSEPSLTVIVDGLTVECPVDLPNSQVQTFLWMSDMTTDLSGQKLVHTQLLDEILEAVQTLEREIPDTLSTRFSTLSDSGKTEWQAPLLGFAAGEGPWCQAYRRFPCLRLVESDGWRSLADLDSGPVTYYTSQYFQRGLRSGVAVVRLEPEAVEAFTRIRRDALDATSTLESHRRYYERLDEWLKVPPEEVRLQWADASLRVPLADFEGELGFYSEAKPAARLFSRQRPLPVQIAHWVPPYVELVVNHDELEMNDPWTGIETKPLLAALKAAVTESLKQLLSRLVAKDFELSLHREQMREALVHLRRDGHSLKRWEEVKFIQETRTEIDTSGLVPVPRRVTERFSLRERPNYFD
jgi:hypothetical protein